MRADPPSARLQEMDRFLRSAELVSFRMLRLLDQARLNHDRAGERCLDLRLAEVNSLLRTLIDRRERVARAPGPAEVEREYRVIQALIRQLRAATRAGHACVFPETAAETGTVVEVIIERDVPEEDLTVRDMARPTRFPFR